MESCKLVVLGDYHLQKFNAVAKTHGGEASVITLGASPAHTFWLTHSDYTVKQFKVLYQNHRLKQIAPDIVILGVGGKDLTRVSDVNCVISAILRLVKFLRKDGVKAVVVLSLIERNVPPPYNTYVKRVNDVVSSKAKTIDGMFYKAYIFRKILASEFSFDGILLNDAIYQTFRSDLKKFLANKVLRYITRNTKKNETSNNSNVSLMEHAEQIGELKTEAAITNLRKDIQDLLRRRSALEGRREKLITSLTDLY